MGLLETLQGVAGDRGIGNGTATQADEEADLVGIRGVDDLVVGDGDDALIAAG